MQYEVKVMTTTDYLCENDLCEVYEWTLQGLQASLEEIGTTMKIDMQMSIERNKVDETIRCANVNGLIEKLEKIKKTATAIQSQLAQVFQRE